MLNLNVLKKEDLTEILLKILQIQKDTGDTLAYISNHLNELTENTIAVQKLNPDKINTILEFQYLMSTFFFGVKTAIQKIVYTAIGLGVLYTIYYIIAKWGLKCL